MKKYALLFLLMVPIFGYGQYLKIGGKYVKVNGYYIKVGDATVTPDPDPDPDPDPSGVVEFHPIAIDQEFLIHQSVQNSDVVGDVQYLCTDTAFNDRSTGSYGWSIVSSSPATGDFSVGSSTGVLTIADASGIISNATDYTLEIEVSHGTAKDTVTCLVIYRSNGSFYDLDAGSNGSGTRASPYNSLANIDNYDLTGGESIFLKRGTSQSITWDINNTGNRVYIGAYGTGDLPNLTYPGSGGACIRTGTVDDNPANDGDSLSIYDIEFSGSPSNSSYGLWVDKGYTDVHLHRCKFYQCSSSNGSAWFRSYPGYAANHEVYGCWFDDSDPVTGERAIKMECNEGIKMYNIWVTNWEGTAFLAGEYGQDFGEIKYCYFQQNGSPFTGPIQFRSQGCTAEWLLIDNFEIGIEFQNYDYDHGGLTDSPYPKRITLRNVIIENSDYGLYVFNAQSPTTAKLDSITLENIYVNSPTYTGFRFNATRDGNNIPMDNIWIKNVLIHDAGTYGIEIEDSQVDDISLQNSIIVGSGTTDIYSDGSSFTGILRNVIYNTKSHTWSTEATNYDVSSGDPFEDDTNGDYRTADGITAVIDQGTDISQVYDIVGDSIYVQDIGPFEKGGTKNNWTNR